MKKFVLLILLLLMLIGCSKKDEEVKEIDIRQDTTEPSANDEQEIVEVEEKIDSGEKIKLEMEEALNNFIVDFPEMDKYKIDKLFYNLHVDYTDIYEKPDKESNSIGKDESSQATVKKYSNGWSAIAMQSSSGEEYITGWVDSDEITFITNDISLDGDKIDKEEFSRVKQQGRYKKIYGNDRFILNCYIFDTKSKFYYKYASHLTFNLEKEKGKLIVECIGDLTKGKFYVANDILTVYKNGNEGSANWFDVKTIDLKNKRYLSNEELINNSEMDIEQVYEKIEQLDHEYNEKNYENEIENHSQYFNARNTNFFVSKNGDLCCILTVANGEAVFPVLYDLITENKVGMVKTRDFDGYLNIRKEPYSSAESIGIVNNGDLIGVSKEEDTKWYKINIGGNTGWVSPDFISF